MTPEDLAVALRDAVAQARAAGELDVTVPAQVRVERPRHRAHGDWASNVAMSLAKEAGRPPREVAEILRHRMTAVSGVDGVDIAGPGFLNITLAAGALGNVAREVLAAGRSYGTGTGGAGRRVNVEFVSSNPTGPVHIGGARWAAVGDSIARLLTATGASVTREFYINDAGVQIDRFAESLLCVAQGLPVPEQGYAGQYIHELAAAIAADHPGLADDRDALKVFRSEGLRRMIDQIRRSLADFGVQFDVYFSEQSLHDRGALGEAVARLRDGGHVYDADGAVWLRTTDFGDDKDRVLVKTDGEPTYFTADAAYYLDKRRRGFDQVLILLGADHHGYLGRMRAMAACFGDDPDLTLELRVGQLVSLLRSGEPVKLSKRAGTLITLEDLVEAVGVDAARYSLARATTDSPLELDLDLVAAQVSENPAFYVQYAATRAASILRHAADLGIEPGPDTDVSLLNSPYEQELLGALSEYPSVAASAAELRAPHRVARHLEERVARAAQRFFDECRVLPRGDEEVTPVTHARLLLWRATRVVLENGLALLGVSAPERM